MLARTSTGHIAFSPRFPDIIGRGGGRNTAYRDFRANLTEHIVGLVDCGVPVPEDDIVFVKFVRLDLRRLEAGIDLT